MLDKLVSSENEIEDINLKYRTKLGVRLFLIYAVVYIIFVMINLIKPVLMEKIVLFGMNLAVTYGIGLIIFAIILALIYNQICARLDNETHIDNPHTGEK